MVGSAIDSDDPGQFLERIGDREGRFKKWGECAKTYFFIYFNTFILRIMGVFSQFRPPFKVRRQKRGEMA